MSDQLFKENVAIILICVIGIGAVINSIGIDAFLDFVNTFFNPQRGEDPTITSVDTDETQRKTRRRAVAGEPYNPEKDTHEIVRYPKTKAQRDMLEEHLKHVIFMKSLDADQHAQILDAFFIKNVQPGEYIIKQGDQGDYFYVIENGTFHASVTENGDENIIHTYTNDGSFGELALLYSMPRAASVKAETAGKIWALDRKTFRRIIVKAAFKNRQDYVENIRKVKILSHLDETQIMNLADAVVGRDFENGQFIMQEGQEADGMYFVLSGKVNIHKVVNGKKVQLKVIEQGGYFGELALLTKGKRAATATANGPTKTAFLDSEAFIRLLGPCEQEMKENITKYGIKSENIT